MCTTGAAIEQVRSRGVESPIARAALGPLVEKTAPETPPAGERATGHARKRE